MKKQMIATILDEPDEVVRRQFGGFVNFIREKAVVGLAVGFVIGQQAQGFIKQLVDSFLTPFINALVGNNLQARQFYLVSHHPETIISWGKFIYVSINFILILFAIYAIVKLFRLDRLAQPIAIVTPAKDTTNNKKI